MVCSGFLISVFIVSKAPVIIRTGGAIWLNAFTMVLFNVCCTHVAWMCVIYFLYCKEECSSPMRDMGLYSVPLSMSLLMGNMFVNFHMCGIMLVLIAVLRMLVRNVSRRGPMFRGAGCLICQDPVSCHFYVVLLSLGLELLWV